MRHRNWDTRLTRCFKGEIGASVEWGENDCVSLCLRGLRAMYPPDDVPLPKDLPEWTTKQGALKVYKREPPFRDVLEDHGCTETGLSFAQQGDIVCGIPGVEEFPGYGICCSGGVYHVHEETVVWTRLAQLRTSEVEIEAVLRPPHE